jgi:hypothetical protein
VPIDLILEILALGIQAAGALFKGNPTAVEQAILGIVQKGYAAYEAQTGKPLDPSLIKPIPPLT